MSNNQEFDQTPETITIEVSEESIDLTFKSTGMREKLPNEDSSYRLVMNTCRNSNGALVIFIENNGLEKPLSDWLKRQGVQTVVIAVQKPSALGTILDNVEAANESVSKAKLVLAGLIATAGGVIWTLIALGSIAAEGHQAASGGIWKGPIIAVLGMALIVIVGKVKSRATQ
ncbi:MAG: hypothetical protein R3C18_17710 [Planctomycetaceae bacterium]